MQTQTKPQPYSIPLNGVTYHHIRGTEDFYIDNPKNTIPALEVLKRGLPHITGAYKKIMPPDKLFKFGYASRLKIIKTIQYCMQPPLVTEETNKFVDFFDNLLNNAGTYYSVSEQWRAALFATNANIQQAAALLLYCGFTPDFNVDMYGASIHKFTPTEDGIIVTIKNEKTFKKRLHAGCFEIEKKIQCSKRTPYHGYLLSIGMRKFHHNGEYYLSVTPEYRQEVKSKIREYIDENTNVFGKGDFSYPDIYEPDIILPDEEIIFKVSDFEYMDAV